MIASGELSFLVYKNEVSEQRGKGRFVTINDLFPNEYILGTVTDSVASFDQYDGTGIPSYFILNRTEIFNFIEFFIEDDDFLCEWDKKWDGNEEMQRLANPDQLSKIWQEITSHVDLQKVHIISTNDEQVSALTLGFA